MSNKEYPIFDQGVQASPQISKLLQTKLQAFVQPLLTKLDQQLDKRLVTTFLALLQTIITFRDRVNGLLLSELGGYLLSPRQAPAGTKRISNLLRSAKWSANLITDFMWQQADQRLVELEANQHTTLALWDESVLEKPESLKSEGLCAVRSSKAKRLTHYKPGYYHPPTGTIFVPGLQWLGIVMLGLAHKSGPAVLAHLSWWTNRTERASDKRTEESNLLSQCMQRWGRQVIHVWDRGFAGAPWLSEVFKYYGKVRFVLRWPKGYKLLGLDPLGLVITSSAGLEVYNRPAWQHFHGKRSRAKYQLWDNRRHCQRNIGVVWAEVRHPDYPEHRLWLVASRPGGGMEPWYLLTSEPVHTAEQAWRIVQIYGRRWQIEVSWRYAKSELSFESPRLWFWDNRLKLLLIASLAFSFLLSLVQESQAKANGMVEWLLRNWCHRTGGHLAKVKLPLYRLRQAVSRLWQAHRPLWPSLQSPG
jgi:hypothetical protein